MPKKRDIKIGEKYGLYTVISDIFIEKKHRKVKCECVCGHIRNIACCNILKTKGCKTCCFRKKTRVLKEGQKKHFLTFLRYLEYLQIDINGQKRSLIEVKCDCGNKKIITSCSFGNIKSCGCLCKHQGINHPSYRGQQNVSKTYFTLIKHNSLKKKREFSIDINYMEKLLIEQNFKCFLTGIPIQIGSKKIETTASLDRIDNNKGYIVGNVQWLHKDINRMKSDFDLDYFKKLCAKVK